MPTTSPSRLEDSPTVLRVAIYCRVSSVAQEENSSLDTQEAQCRQYAAEHGWIVVGNFRDVHTGAELFERPGLSQLREELRKGTTDVVLAHALDRISRNQAHLGFLVSELDHLGVQLTFVTEELADTPEGRLLQSVRGFVAEIERLKIAERTKRGVRARVDSGRPIPGRKAPYGYAWRDAERSGFVVNEVEAKVVRRLFEAMLQGATLRGLANLLTRDGIPTPTQRRPVWEVSSISRILKHPIYTGNPAAYRTRYERVRGQVRVTYQPESEWVSLPKDVAPALVSEDVFAAVSAKLAHNKAVAPRNNANPSATLLRCGIGRCGYCGRPLQVTRRTNRSHMYRCHPVGRRRHQCPSFGVMAHILDEAVWTKVKEVLLDPSTITKEVDRYLSSDVFSFDLEGIERRLQDIGRRQSRLAQAVASLDDPDASAPLLVELKQLSADSHALKRERDRIQARANRHQQKRQALDTLDVWCERVAQNMRTLTYEEKRTVLETLGVSVRVFSSSHDPRWLIEINPLG